MFRREVEQRFGDLELCRTQVARAAGIPWEEVEAGSLALRWTILPSGGTRDPLVLEEEETSLPLMRCVRRHMDGWHFTAPRNRPVLVEFGYSFFEPAGKS
jgi:hypothetical protein